MKKNLIAGVVFSLALTGFFGGVSFAADAVAPAKAEVAAPAKAEAPAKKVIKKKVSKKDAAKKAEVKKEEAKK
jgi:hypothetical protein